MSISKELRRSAKDFCTKYVCSFDFAKFETKVEGYTFLNPNNGWRDVYKLIFDGMYKQALEAAAKNNGDLDAEAMLDDFEYTLIRPYVNESETAIRHKPYVGMDRVARLEFLEKLTTDAPSTPAALCTEKYRSGMLSIKQMALNVKAPVGSLEDERERSIETASYIYALEDASKCRSLLWKTFHPFKCNAEKRESASMKTALIKEGGEVAYQEIERAAHRTFETHKKAILMLEVNMKHAQEEKRRHEQMKSAMRESLVAADFGKESDIDELII